MNTQRLLTLVLLAAVSVGCSKYIRPPDPATWFRRKPATEQGIVTPHERAEWLAHLSDTAGDLSPAERQTRSQELALAIQKEEDPGLRGQILKTLATLDTDVSLRVLKAARNDTDSDVRLACCQAWRKRGGAEACEALIEILQSDTDLDVRMAAARQLGELGDPAAVPALGRLLEDRDPAMQYRAVCSLREITGKDFGDDVNAWREFVGGGNPSEQSALNRLFRWF